MRTHAAPFPRKRLAAGALAAACLAASLAVAADQASAGYTGQVAAGVLKITGDAASDKVALLVDPSTPSTLLVDVGEDGTVVLSFDRSTFTAIDVAALGGDDEIRVDLALSTFIDAPVRLDGGSGDDTLIGGSGPETIAGGVGD